MSKTQEKIDKINTSGMSTQGRIDAKIDMMGETLNAYRLIWVSIPEHLRTSIKGCLSHETAAIIEAEESSLFLKPDKNKIYRFSYRNGEWH